MTFADRADAGRRLATALQRFRAERPVVLALPRGGVPVAEPVAIALDAPLDLVFVRKIRAPGSPELAMGAVAERIERAVVRNRDVISALGVDEAAFQAACTHEFAEIARRRRSYLGGAASRPLAGRVAIVVDDGVATGATTRAALEVVRAERPAKLVLAVPVGPTDTIARLRTEADEVICLENHRSFLAVGIYYETFTQVSDAEVAAALRRSEARAQPVGNPT